MPAASKSDTTKASGPQPKQAVSEKARMAERFRERYFESQYEFVEFITEHLADCSRTFGGDLQQVVLLAIIGQVYLRAANEAARAGRPMDERQTVISSSRLADATGIARETARRKLNELERRGWIQRVNKGWQLTVVDGEAPAGKALAQLDARGLDRLARLYVGLRRFE